MDLDPLVRSWTLLPELGFYPESGTWTYRSEFSTPLGKGGKLSSNETMHWRHASAMARRALLRDVSLIEVWAAQQPWGTRAAG
jgi:hypothetical protein